MLVVFEDGTSAVGRLHHAITFGPGFGCHYQRGSRRPPPPPPPRLAPKPPPPPKPPSGFGRASLTVSARPPIWYWLKSAAAFCASSSVDISTKAKPRARPVAASRITRTDSTFPAWLKSSCSSASPVV